MSFVKTASTALLLSLSASTAAATEHVAKMPVGLKTTNSDTLKVIVFAGQSNMEGQAEVESYNQVKKLLLYMLNACCACRDVQVSKCYVLLLSLLFWVCGRRAENF